MNTCHPIPRYYLKHDKCQYWQIKEITNLKYSFKVFYLFFLFLKYDEYCNIDFNQERVTLLYFRKLKQIQNENSTRTILDCKICINEVNNKHKI